MQKGDFNVIFKMIELIDKSNLNSFQTEESESFNNLIGAIKNVRKIEPRQNEFLIDLIDEKTSRIN